MVIGERREGVKFFFRSRERQRETARDRSIDRCSTFILLDSLFSTRPWRFSSKQMHLPSRALTALPRWAARTRKERAEKEPRPTLPHRRLSLPSLSYLVASSPSIARVVPASGVRSTKQGAAEDEALEESGRAGELARE